MPLKAHLLQRSTPSISRQRKHDTSVDLASSVNVLQKGALVGERGVARYESHYSLHGVRSVAARLAGLVARVCASEAGVRTATDDV